MKQNSVDTIGTRHHPSDHRQLPVGDPKDKIHLQDQIVYEIPCDDCIVTHVDGIRESTQELEVALDGSLKPLP